MFIENAYTGEVDVCLNMEDKGVLLGNYVWAVGKCFIKPRKVIAKQDRRSVLC